MKGITMKKFSQYIEMQDQMAADAMPTDAPVTPAADPADDVELSKLGQTVRKFLKDRLAPLLAKNPMNKAKAIRLLSTIVSEISNETGLSASDVQKAGKMGMTTNSEPVSPPLTQPTARG